METPNNKKIDIRRLLITLLLVLLAAVVSGGTTYYVVGTQAERERWESERALTETKNQNENLGTERNQGENGLGSQGASEKDSPSEMMEYFLTRYLGIRADGSDVGESYSSRDSSFVERFISENKRKNMEIARQSWQGGGSFDMLILAQNIPSGRGFTVGKAAIDGSTAIVPVILNFGSPYFLTYQLVLEGDQWKIDSVTPHHDRAYFESLQRHQDNTQR